MTLGRHSFQPKRLIPPHLSYSRFRLRPVFGLFSVVDFPFSFSCLEGEGEAGEGASDCLTFEIALSQSRARLGLMADVEGLGRWWGDLPSSTRLGRLRVGEAQGGGVVDGANGDSGTTLLVGEKISFRFLVGVTTLSLEVKAFLVGEISILTGERDGMGSSRSFWWQLVSDKGLKRRFLAAKKTVMVTKTVHLFSFHNHR